MPGKRSNGEGTLRKRPNGLWECTMMVGYQEDGRRRYKSFYGKSQKEAKDKAEVYKRDTAAGLYIDPNLTFQEWAQKWYGGYRDSVSPTTYESYGYTLKILIGAFGPRKLGSIKPPGRGAVSKGPPGRWEVRFLPDQMPGYAVSDHAQGGSQ